MTNKRIRIEKVAEVPGGIPANPKDAHEPGQDQGEKFSLPVEYWIEGILAREMEVGQPVVVLRDIRNGVNETGVFNTTPLTELTDKTFKTRNSVYQYRYV